MLKGSPQYALDYCCLVVMRNQKPHTFNRGRASTKASSELSFPDTDISFVSSGRPSTERSLPFSSDSLDLSFAARLSHSWEAENKFSFGSPFAGSRADSNNNYGMYSASSQDSGTSWASSPQSMVCKFLSPKYA